MYTEPTLGEVIIGIITGGFLGWAVGKLYIWWMKGPEDGRKS